MYYYFWINCIGYLFMIQNIFSHRHYLMLKCEQKLLVLSFLGRKYGSSGRVQMLYLTERRTNGVSVKWIQIDKIVLMKKKGNSHVASLTHRKEMLICGCLDVVNWRKRFRLDLIVPQQAFLLPPANEGSVFTSVCLSFCPLEELVCMPGPRSLLASGYDSASDPAAGWGGGGKKHEIYVAVFGGHLFYDLFVQSWGGHGPLGTPRGPLLWLVPGFFWGGRWVGIPEVVYQVERVGMTWYATSLVLISSDGYQNGSFFDDVCRFVLRFYNECLCRILKIFSMAQQRLKQIE